MNLLKNRANDYTAFEEGEHKAYEGTAFEEEVVINKILIKKYSFAIKLSLSLRRHSLRRGGKTRSHFSTS